MKSSLFLCLFAATSLLVASTTSDATSLAHQRFIVRRQSGETEKESTTSSSTNTNNGNQMQQLARLYPDLPQQPGLQQPYPTGPQGPFQPNFHGAPTPFVPFSPQLSPGQLSDLQRRMQQQRPMSPSERLQSQTFTNGLGRRLLAMIGLDQGNPEAAAAGNETTTGANPTMRALQNSTVLQQLSGGVQSIYGSLSKMYNSTVQQQLNLLQERFKKEAENSTNPWQQRMTQQVPMFFKNMAAKVGDAQQNLDRIWKQVLAQASGNGSAPAPSASTAEGSMSQNQGFFSSIDRFINPNGGAAGSADMFGGGGGGNFFDQFGRSLGFGNNAGAGQPGGQDLGSQLMGFWQNQVQPQIGMVRGQMARVWRDLTASGALVPPDPMLMRRNQFNTQAAAPSENSSASSPELVDEILKEIDMNNSEYTLLEPKDDRQQPQQANIGPQMQNRLITMQRELNQLWSGLTTSLQNAIGGVRNTLNPRPAQQFGLTPMGSNENKQEADPEENEIGGKVKDLGRLQKEADTVHDVLRQQQQQQQQRQGFGDRFRSLFNNVDLANEFNQLPTRFGDSMSRFGSAVGDLWNQIPRRWDNFMENMSPRPEMARAKLMAATDKPTTAAPEKPLETISN